VRKRSAHSYEEIARSSGVSISTISRVINRSASVSPGMRGKVIAALREKGIDVASIDFEPLPRDDLFIFNVPTLKNPFYSPIIEAARIDAERHGYHLLVSENLLNAATVDGFLSLLRRTKASGLVCVNSVSRPILRKIAGEIPMVCCCEGDNASGVPYVTIDDEAAAEDAVKYLLSLGRRRIALINGPENFKYARARLKGYARALAAAGVEMDPSLIASVSADMDFEMAKAHAERMFSLDQRPDAFFCISDVLASAAIKAAFSKGLDVPRDVAVVGFDNIQVAKIMRPSLTTVYQPTDQIGTLAVEMLLRILKDGTDAVQSVTLGAELIIRESTVAY
jgi:LacI family repressor for deo operon, udp, cdd, tsx, nupC, and nupG